MSSNCLRWSCVRFTEGDGRDSRPAVRRRHVDSPEWRRVRAKVASSVLPPRVQANRLRLRRRLGRQRGRRTARTGV